MRMSLRCWVFLATLFLRMPLAWSQGNCTSTLEQEYQALMALYQSTNGAGWTNKTGWSTADPAVVQSVAGWYGVTTDAEGRIISLSLAQNNLSGQIPLEIGSLCHLVSVSLGNNKLNGTIPVEIGNLANLQVLSLPVNQLTGSIPSEIGNLTKLTRLALAGNKLSGSIPFSIGGLAVLTSLDLTNNQITGEIPSSIANLTNLTFLHLRINQLSGPIPSVIGNLAALKNLALDNNKLDGAIPVAIGNLTNLEVLWLQANQLSGSIPSEIGSLTKLYNLALQANKLTGSIPSTIGNLTALTSLELTSNQISGEIPETIGNLNKLTFLHLRINQLSGSIPSTIGNLSALKNLALDNNLLSGSIPSTIGNLRNLEVLWLQVNQLNGSIPAEIGELTKLYNLALQANKLTGPIPNTIGNLVALTSLELANNYIIGEIPFTIGDLTALKTLTLNNNTLEGSIPVSIGDLVNLEVLRLQANQLTGTIPQESSKMSSLRIIDLSGNHLEGVVPIIPGVTTFNLQTNEFSFVDFLPAKENFSGSTFGYAPQGLVDTAKTIKAVLGSMHTFTAPVDRNTNPASIFQWFKIVNGTTVALNAASVGGHTVSSQIASHAESGVKYYYTITNPGAPGLTLTSHYQTLQVITCTSPTVDFATEQNNGIHTFIPSFNSEGCTPTFTWDFGDGATSTEQAPTHAYTSTGTFTVALTVSYTCDPCPSGQLTKQHDVVIENGFCGSIYCDDAGGVGIGTRMTEGFRLSVNGKIRASDIIKVYPQNQWSDFVFEKDYRLRPLIEVEAFIKKNGHLPEIPSAREVAKDGIDLGAMDAKLLQKIEELTLYLIRMHADMKAIDLKIRMLEEENKVLKQVHKK